MRWFSISANKFCVFDDAIYTFHLTQLTARSYSESYRKEWKCLSCHDSVIAWRLSTVIGGCRVMWDDVAGWRTGNGSRSPMLTLVHRSAKAWAATRRPEHVLWRVWKSAIGCVLCSDRTCAWQFIEIFIVLLVDLCFLEIFSSPILAVLSVCIFPRLVVVWLGWLSKSVHRDFVSYCAMCLFWKSRHSCILGQMVDCRSATQHTVGPRVSLIQLFAFRRQVKDAPYWGDQINTYVPCIAWIGGPQAYLGMWGYFHRVHLGSVFLIIRNTPFGDYRTYVDIKFSRALVDVWALIL